MGTTVKQLATTYEPELMNWLENILEELNPLDEKDDQLIRRAHQLMRNDSIRLVSYDPTTEKIGATIQDVHHVSTSIEFLFQQFTCSCGSKTICRHALSMLMLLYLQNDSLSELLKEWRTRNERFKNIKLETPTTHIWEEAISSIYKRARKQYHFHYRYEFNAFLERVLHQTTAIQPLQREWKPILEVYTRLLILTLLVKDLDENQLHQFIDYEADGFLQSTLYHIDLLGSRPQLFAADPFYSEMKIALRWLMKHAESKNITQFYPLYLQLWENVWKDQTSRLEELDYWQNEYVGTTDFEIIFSILLNTGTSEAKKMVETLDSHEADHLWELVKFAERRQANDWKVALLHSLLPVVGTLSNVSSNSREATALVQQVLRAFEAIELSPNEREQLYLQFHSIGLHAYSLYLLKIEDYKRWVLLHYAMQTTLSFADRCGLKDVTQAAPDLVLPIYHSHAIYEVDQKSRMSYKQAVRIWKRMKTACKKSGKLNYWNTYMNEIQQKYKRLRALQEEIQKGRLVTE